MSRVNKNKQRSWRNGCGFQGDMDSCRMWVTPRDFPLSFSGLPLTLLVSCGERIGPTFLDVCAGCSLEPSQRRGIFSGSLHEVEKSLRRIVSPAACELPVPAPPCLWSCPSSHRSSRADTSATAISSLIGGPRWAEMCRTGQGATDTAAAAEGPVGAMPETLCVFHPFACR